MRKSALFVALAAAGLAADAADPSAFEAPVRLQAGGEFIDTEIGHAAPMVADFDGDGVKDLLVGQFGDGKLWIFRNKGSNTEPLLSAGELFKEGRPEGTVPTG